MTAATLAEVSRQATHWSWRERQLQKLAGPGVDLTDWLVEQLNQRGFLGAFNARPLGAPSAPDMPVEALVVALLRPRAVAEARLFKLVVRALQSGRLSVPALRLEARRERVDHVLYWLLQLVPSSERNVSLEAIAQAFSRPPRGYRGVGFRYDPRRLERRPATERQLWRAKQS